MQLRRTYFEKQLTCTCSKFLTKLVLVREIRLKKLFVDQVRVNSRKTGRRDFRQSILTHRLEATCAVKIYIPRIFKWEY